MSGNVEITEALREHQSQDQAPELRQISPMSINPNDANFYHVDEDESELAANIAQVGLLEPLIVAETAAGYRLISGHRRLQAILSLYKEDPDRWSTVPCFVRQYKDELEERLALIFANASTRKLTDAELSRQAEEVNEILYRLKEEGYEFAGRMRDQVAQACNVSASKLARLKLIREGLDERWKGLFDVDKLPEQTAVAIAKMPQNVQADLWTASEKKNYQVPGTAAVAISRDLDQIYDPDRTCPDLHGDPCEQQTRMLKQYVCEKSWEHCSSQCCLNCYNVMSCSNACKISKDKMKEKKREEQRKQARDQIKLDQKRLETYRDACSKARRLAECITPKVAENLTSYCIYIGNGMDAVKDYEVQHSPTSCSTPLPYGTAEAIRLADDCDVNIQWLYTGELHLHRLKDRKPAELQDVLGVCSHGSNDWTSWEFVPMLCAGGALYRHGHDESAPEFDYWIEIPLPKKGCYPNET